MPIKMVPWLEVISPARQSGRANCGLKCRLTRTRWPKDAIFLPWAVGDAQKNLGVTAIAGTAPAGEVFAAKFFKALRIGRNKLFEPGDRHAFVLDFKGNLSVAAGSRARRIGNGDGTATNREQPGTNRRPGTGSPTYRGALRKSYSRGAAIPCFVDVECGQVWKRGEAGASFQRLGDIDHEAIPDVAFNHPAERIVDALDGNELDLRQDVVFTAEIQDFLGLRDASDQRSGQGPAMKGDFAVIGRQGKKGSGIPPRRAWRRA